MTYHICHFAILFLVLSLITAYDPFEGMLVSSNYPKSRRITGCSETLLEAYKESGYSEGDQNVNDADTRLYLFTKDNKEYAEFLHNCGGRLPNNTLFEPKRRTIFILGGHLSSIGGFAYFRDMKNQLLFRGSYNIIIADWFWGNGPDLYMAGVNAEVVGKQIAFVIENIMTQKGVLSKDIYIIGHSFGAHAAGYAGRYLFERTGDKVGRITGLDPYGANFIGIDPKNKLDSSDAQLVDVIHAGAGRCFPFAYGTTDKSGHADFNPNGGSIQLSCYPDLLRSFLLGDFYVGAITLFPGACYFFQSVRFFIASINPCECQFVGVECRNYTEFQSGQCRSCGADGSKCAVMGFDFDKYRHDTGNHSYYLNTELLCPYCKKGDINLEGFSTTTAGKLHCFTP